jgi:hypothetical protein
MMRERHKGAHQKGSLYTKPGLEVLPQSDEILSCCPSSRQRLKTTPKSVGGYISVLTKVTADISARQMAPV